MLSVERRWRGPYQSMFEHGTVTKTYRALAPFRADLELPVTVRNHITRIFDKIGVEHRYQAIVRAREAGLGQHDGH